MVPRSRRQFLHGGVAVGSASVAGCVFGFGNDSACSDGRTLHESDVTLPQTAAWPTYQHDAANTGYNPDASGPSEDGEVAWRYSACTEAESGVVITDGHAYAGGLVVNGRTGQANGGDWHGHMSTPTAANETLYVSAFDLEARNPTTGESRWTFQTDVDRGALPAPTVASETVYVPGSIDDPTLYAIDAERGAERWRFDTRADVDVPVAAVGGTVYVVDEADTLYALDAATGDERWRQSHATDVSRSAPVVANDRIYLGSWDGGVHALHTTDGSQDWRQQGEQTDFRIGGPVAVAEETVFAAGREGTVTALGATDGQVQWTVSTEAYELGPPAIADGVVYVGAAAQSSAGTLLALDSTTGEEHWRVETREVLFGDYTRMGINRSPAVVDGVVYVATAPGDLYAIRGR